MARDPPLISDKSHCEHRLLVATRLCDEIRAQASGAYPNEACGVLLGDGVALTAIRPAVNVHPSPAAFFEIDPQVLVDVHRAARAGGAQVAGYYHSHPNGPALPSATDTAMATGDGLVWAIAGCDGDVTFWRDGKKGFEALSYSLAHR